MATDMLPFVKMEGAGNDYVYVDAIARPFPPDLGPATARAVADRHFGIGGDGLIVLAPSEVADVAMWMWNADGSRSTMCGNGIRCLAKLAHDHGHVHGSELTVETDAGVKPIVLQKNAAGAVAGAVVQMGTVAVTAEPVAITAAARTFHYHAAHAGNDHAVVFVDEDPRDCPVTAIGVAIQQSEPFAADGVNVEVVQVRSDGTLMQRTYERGSGETLACGTGATAAACVAIETGRVPGPEVIVELLGGRLTITRGADGCTMAGPARTVFRGEFPLSDGDRGEA